MQLTRLSTVRWCHRHNHLSSSPISFTDTRFISIPSRHPGSYFRIGRESGHYNLFDRDQLSWFSRMQLTRSSTVLQRCARLRAKESYERELCTAAVNGTHDAPRCFLLALPVAWRRYYSYFRPLHVTRRQLRPDRARHLVTHTPSVLPYKYIMRADTFGCNQRRI